MRIIVGTTPVWCARCAAGAHEAGGTSSPQLMCVAAHAISQRMRVTSASVTSARARRRRSPRVPDEGCNQRPSEVIRGHQRGHQRPSERPSEAIRCTEWLVGDKEGEASPRHKGLESTVGALGGNRDRYASLAYCTRRATLPAVTTPIGCKAEGGRCGHVGREEAVARVLGFG